MSPNSPLAILTPSRERPDNIARLANAIHATATGPWELFVGLDDDDPAMDGYQKTIYADLDTDVWAHLSVVIRPRRNLVEWTNYLAKQAAADGYPYLASLGDDHLPRTPGWDIALTRACTLFGPVGYAYGDDLLRPDLPTAWVQSTAIYEALGWMMLPTCEHLYVDNVTLDLGHAADRIARLDHIVIEHMHPAAGKAAEDDSYRASNSAERVNADRAAYERWVRHGLTGHAETIRSLR